MSPRLTDLDASRAEDPEGVLKAYLRHDPLCLAEDSDRLAWVLEQFEGKPLEPISPLISAIERAGSAEQRRQLHSFLAAQLYTSGKTEEAEALWRQTVESGVGERDRWWLCSANNLALILMRRGAWFESLVLFGESERTAQLVGVPRSGAVAATRRAQTLIQLGDDSRALESLERAERRALELEATDRIRVRGMIASVRGLFHRRREEFEEGLVAHNEEILHLEALPSTPYPVWVSAQTFRITCEFHLPGADREALIAELRALGEDACLGKTWRGALARDIASLELDLRSTEGAEASFEAAQSLYEHLSETLSGSTLVRHLCRLADRFHSLGEVEWARRALDRAARETLQRLAEVIRLAGSLGTLLQPTEEDLRILSAFRMRLLEEQRQHFEAFVALWRGGEIPLDEVFQEGATRVCAWCRSFLSSTGAWIPLADFLPPEEEILASHTICSTCEAKHFDIVRVAL